ncbi:MBL fold metallo-hydrolase [uncultured Veillonella sp.]|uniref:MBL fold metallo-hydrolase n=1 Tax=uncultured Veillonella sp. TaxID=159268 RepID=UPI00261F1B47|nr:MBL fold metallo-hydrolase [uncultured Veillonella sp.]
MTQYTHIRNATGKLTIKSTTFLIDPFLAPKDTYPGFEGTFNYQQRMPMVDLPVSMDNLLSNVTAVVVTHTHLDHWDDTAIKSIPKSLPIFVQNTADKELITSQGFNDVRIIFESLEFNGITLRKTGGSHGTVEMYANPVLAPLAGDAMGVIFEAEDEPTVYLVGDTVWTSDVEKALLRFDPNVIIMNTGYAQILGFEDSIIMGTKDIGRMVVRKPEAKIIAVHMDTVNHTVTSRKDVHKFIKGTNIESHVAVPEDGETIVL